MRPPGKRLLIVNGRSAGSRATRDLVAAARAAAPGSVSVQATDSAVQAREALSALRTGDRVIIAGGDGSIHALLNLLVQQGLELAVLPVGSGNDVARALGVRPPVEAAMLEHAMRAPASPMDLGEVTIDSVPRWWISSVAVGFDAAVNRRAGGLSARWGGRARYLRATLSELRSLNVHDVDLWIDGVRTQRGDALLASAMNTSTYGGGMPLAPQALIDDGRLDVVLAQRMSRLHALRLLPRLLAGTHVSDPQVSIRQGREVIWQARRAPVPIAVDGEDCGVAGHIVTRVRPGVLQAVRG